MKKRSLRERKEAFKAAYRSELMKQGVIDTPEEKEAEKAPKEEKTTTRKTTKKEVEE